MHPLVRTNVFPPCHCTARWVISTSALAFGFNTLPTLPFQSPSFKVHRLPPPTKLYFQERKWVTKKNVWGQKPLPVWWRRLLSCAASDLTAELAGCPAWHNPMQQLFYKVKFPKLINVSQEDTELTDIQAIPIYHLRDEEACWLRRAPVDKMLVLIVLLKAKLYS